MVLNVFQHILIFSALFLTVTDTNGQTAIEYFIPNAPINFVGYRTIDSADYKIRKVKNVSFIRDSETYRVSIFKMYSARPVSFEVITIKYSPAEILMIESSIDNGNRRSGPPFKNSKYDPARVILKIPSTGQSVSWNYLDIVEDSIKCTATWDTMDVNNLKKKVLKVKKQSKIWSRKTIEYYVRGIGLWKTELESQNGTTHTLDTLCTMAFSPQSKPDIEQAYADSVIGTYLIKITGLYPTRAIEIKSDKTWYEYEIKYKSKSMNDSLAPRINIGQWNFSSDTLILSVKKHFDYTVPKGETLKYFYSEKFLKPINGEFWYARLGEPPLPRKK